MRNFLNTTFKFLSRSIVISTLLSISVLQVTAQTPNPGGQPRPTITEFKSSTVTAIPEGNWTLSWKASNAAGCLLVTPDCGGSGSVCGGGFYNPNSQVKLDDNGMGTYSYTLKCYAEIQQITTIGDGEPTFTTKYTVTSPVPQTANGPISDTGLAGTSQEVISSPVTVKVVDANQTSCLNAPNPELCSAMCGAYGNESGSCQTCKTDAEKCESFADRCLVDGQKPENQSPSELNICRTADINQAEEQGGVDKTPEDPDQSGGRCFPKLMGGAGFDVTGCIINILDVTTVPLAASFLQLCAYIFEFAVQISIVQFSNLVSGNGDWLTSIWRTIRDVLNIFVIFILLYSAIKVIVGQGGEIKKLISGVILFGVLTNFSLFITKAAVDLSNIVALEFYQQMRNAPLSEARFSNGLGATIVGITGLTNLYDPQGAISGGSGSGISATTTKKIAGTPLQNSIMYRIAMIFVFIAVAFVFLQAAFIFVARTLSIIVLLIFSPLMFAGGVFSPLKEWIDKWWKDFVGQIALAPVFMILLYVVLTILRSLVKATNSMTAERNDIYALLGLIILTSALTIFGFGLVIKTAREFSRGVGEKGVSKALGWSAQAAGLVGGFVGRNTMGRIGKSLLSGDSATGNALRENAAKNTLASRLFSRNILRAAGSVSKSEFDVRSSPVGSGIGKIIDASNKYTKGNVQIDAGKATTAGGFAGRLKKDTEEQTKQDVATLKEREGLLKAEGDTREIKKANSDRKKAFEANGGYNREIFEATADFITGRGIKTSLVTGGATGQSVREDAITELKKKSKKSKNEDELKIWKKDLLRYTKFGTEPAEKFLPDDVEVNGKKVSDYKSKEDLEDALVELDEIDTKKLWEKMQGEAEAAPATNSKRSKALQRAKAAPSQISKLAEAIEKEERVEEKKKENNL